MARTIRNVKIDTRSARVKLTPRREPYWIVITQGCIVGYRKGAKGGAWIAKYRAEDGKRVHRALGSADDAGEADGIKILSYSQAQEVARRWFTEQSRIDAGLDGITCSYTVDDAIRDYLEWYKGEKSPNPHTLGTITSRIDAFILPALGAKEVAKLTSRQIRNWMNDLVKVPPRSRTSKFSKDQNYRDVDTDDPDYQRRRRHTVNKIMTTLKAALNHAWREERVLSDLAWRKVKPFPKVDAPRIRYLKDQEVVRLVNACPSSFRGIVQGALLTGARYSELCSMKVDFFDADAGTVMILDTKTKKVRHSVLAEEGVEFFQQQTMGRMGDEKIFLRDDGKPWGKSHQQRPIIAACRAAKISPVISFHILRHTHGSRLAMQGVPMGVIAAQLGHSDTRMTEKHYAHLAPSYVADTIRASFGRMGIVDKSKVSVMGERR
jgi:integrase